MTSLIVPVYRTLDAAPPEATHLIQVHDPRSGLLTYRGGCSSLDEAAGQLQQVIMQISGCGFTVQIDLAHGRFILYSSRQVLYLCILVRQNGQPYEHPDRDRGSDTGDPLSAVHRLRHQPLSLD